MKAILAIAALIAAAPLAAEEQSPEQAEVIAAADAFFAALRSKDKTALATMMIPDRTILVNDKTGPGLPRQSSIPVAKHLENWAKSPPGLDEYMIYQSIVVDGDKAQVWGPYRFLADSKTTHCGQNLLTFERTANGWKLGDTAFTMVPPADCEMLGAPEAPEQ
jgi:ketosteroid isomerase-like protein